MFEISEQWLADQVKQVKHNQWLTEVEVEEMSRIISQTETGDDAEEVQEEEQVVAAGELASSQNACSDGVQRQTRQVSQGDPLEFV